jgi:hypothetical protein
VVEHLPTKYEALSSNPNTKTKITLLDYAGRLANLSYSENLSKKQTNKAGSMARSRSWFQAQYDQNQIMSTKTKPR